MSEWIDATLKLSAGLATWPGDEPFRREILQSMGDGAAYNLSRLSMGAHAGTHMDAPLHFIADGASIDRIDPDLLIGSAYVLDLTHLTAHIDAADLKGRVPEGTVRLLVRTRGSAVLGDGVFHQDFIAFTPAAAAFLAASGVRLLGLDTYSIGPFYGPAEAHRAFLGTPGSAAIENVNLKDVLEGWYDLVCLPLRVAGGEGSPARVLLRKREGQGA